MKFLTVFLIAVSAWAHHSFSAEFDENRPVELHGTVMQMEWVNPHTWIHIAVKNPDGSITNWMIEGNTPNSLLRRGLTKRTLEPGTEVVVRGYQAKTGEPKASGGTLTFKNGRTLSVGSSGDALLNWVSSDETIWRKEKGESQ